MPEIAATVDYECECGKKWTFTIRTAATKQLVKCTCGRTIVIENGVIYSTKKAR